MLESREFQGYWWLPFLPDGKIPGTLQFSQADIRLELLGGFAQGLQGSGDEPVTEQEGSRQVVVDMASFISYQSRILGVAQNGRPVTLERCNGRTLSFGFPQFATSVYGPHFVLVGAWYEPDEEVAFDEITVRYSDLDIWAGVSGFDIKANTTADGTSLASIDSTFTPPDPIEVALDDGTTMEIEFPYTLDGIRPVTTDFRIFQTATVRIAFQQPANIERSLSYVATLRNFLALAVGRPIRVLSVHGFHNPPADAEPDSFTGVRPRKLDVEILYRLVGVPEAAKDDLHPRDWLFTLSDIRPRLEEILTTWFARQEQLGPVLARYFHLVHTTPSSREHEFESLVRVLETHHRRTVPGPGKSPEHEARLAAILSSAPDEHREWLDKKLQFSHEPSLPERLADTLARCPTITSQLIGNSAKKRKSFIRKVTQTRNYETHLDPSIQAEAARGARLLTLVTQLRPLVEMTLLLEIGFTCEEAAGLFEREGEGVRFSV